MGADLQRLIPAFMLVALLPLWFLAGAADYWLHRRSNIERTSGWPETRLHVLQALEVAVPLLAGLFLAINATVIAIMLAFLLAHTLTALWDVSYAISRRYISPLEQHVHSHLEYIPMFAVALVILLNWSSFRALLGGAAPAGSFGLHLKAVPLPAAVLVLTLGALLILQILLGDEVLRSWRWVHGSARVRPLSHV